MIKPLPPTTEKAAVDLYPRAPTVGISKPGDELRQPQYGYQMPIPVQIVPVKQYVAQTEQEVAQRPIAEPRRFHMTRGKAQKTQSGRKESIATFHERKPGSAPTELLKSVPVDSTQPIITAPTPPRPQQLPAQLQHLRGKASVTQIKLTPVSAVPARRNSPAPIAPLRGQRMASGQIMPFNASMEQLDREMQAHTLAQMGAIMAANEPKAPATPTRQANGSTQRYTPKSTQRLRDRHPEIAAAKEEKLVQEAESKMDVDVDMDEDDEDFVVETYIRVPVEQLGIGSKEQSIGLLVLDSQPDIDQFYGEDDESDSDIYDEEEDENGKLHLTAVLFKNLD